MKLRSYNDYRLIYHLYSYSTILPCGIGTVQARLASLFRQKTGTDLTILTFSIFPECTRIWYFFIKKVITCLAQDGLSTKVLIVDCSGKLQPKHFHGATVIRYMNDTHPHKLDFFVYKYITSSYVWISDDDCFVFDADLSKKAITDMKANDKLAVCSFMPRRDWWFSINEKKIRPMGSYCLIVSKKIIEKERLSFLNLNTHNPHNKRTYDTADYMNEQLLKRGYEIRLPPDQSRDKGIGGFKGSSIWKAFEWGCPKKELSCYFSRPFSMEYHVRHNLKAFYIAAKIFIIYKKMFGTPAWTPVFSVEELLEIVKNMKDGNDKKGITDDLAWVDTSYDEIVFKLK
jgi:hypothetical protein